MECFMCKKELTYPAIYATPTVAICKACFKSSMEWFMGFFLKATKSVLKVKEAKKHG